MRRVRLSDLLGVSMATIDDLRVRACLLDSEIQGAADHASLLVSSAMEAMQPYGHGLKFPWHNHWLRDHLLPKVEKDLLGSPPFVREIVKEKSLQQFQKPPSTQQFGVVAQVFDLGFVKQLQQFWSSLKFAFQYHSLQTPNVKLSGGASAESAGALG